MNKEQIIKILKKYKLNIKEYIVISGAAMVILGIKEKTNDIDISVTKEYYEYLKNNYNVTFDKINRYNNEVYFIDNVINFGIDYYTENYINVDGINVETPNEILKLKRSLNREKDLKDIKLIENYMKDKNE